MEQEQRNEAEQNPAATGPLFTVVDIPETATAEETAELLNGQFDQGVYVAAVVPWTAVGVGARVFLRRYAAPKPRAAEARTAEKTTAASAPTTNAPATREARAMAFLRNNREMTVKQLVAAFKALGAPRSAGWITKKRVEVIRAERRVS